MKQPWEIIQELESDNSRLFKESVIEVQALENNQEFFNGVKLALDALITFGVKKVPEKTSDSGNGLSWNYFKQVTDALAERRLTGNLAITAVNDLMNKATQKEWNY